MGFLNLGSGFDSRLGLFWLLDKNAKKRARLRDRMLEIKSLFWSIREWKAGSLLNFYDGYAVLWVRVPCTPLIKLVHGGTVKASL